MRNIGLCHYNVGGTDGVSLEMDKWKAVLEKLGHKVHFCAGNLGGRDGFAIEELQYRRDDIRKITQNAFFRLEDYKTENELENDILRITAKIEDKLRKFIKAFSIDLLIPNNIWSIGFNLPAAVALARIVRDCRIPAIAHHHDFYWESCRKMIPTCSVIHRLAQEYLPPNDEAITHVVINSLVKAELSRRNGLQSFIIPNVFDFSGDPWVVDEYNRSFRQSINVGENDVLVLQATRIVERKAIELAIALVDKINEPSNIARLRGSTLYDGRKFDEHSQVVLVLAGSADNQTDSYVNRLKRLIKQTGIQARFIGKQIRSRRMQENGLRFHSLWDCYVFADLVTYPSLSEGWGNQFLETIRARLPVAMFEYPVYQADIKPKGFDIISLGDKANYKSSSGIASVDRTTLEQAARKSVEVLINPFTRKEIVEKNFALAKTSYSYESLARYLNHIIPGQA
jgi:glycosyltransferase involved in cell wall biosynthesis